MLRTPVEINICISCLFVVVLSIKMKIMAKANPIKVQKYLKGIDYPAKKEELVRQAQKNGAEKEIISVLNEIKEEEFNSPAELSKAISHVE
jgi:hypothetical protein